MKNFLKISRFSLGFLWFFGYFCALSVDFHRWAQDLFLGLFPGIVKRPPLRFYARFSFLVNSLFVMKKNSTLKSAIIIARISTVTPTSTSVPSAELSALSSTPSPAMLRIVSIILFIIPFLKASTICLLCKRGYIANPSGFISLRFSCAKTKTHFFRVYTICMAYPF